MGRAARTRLEGSPAAAVVDRIAAVVAMFDAQIGMLWQQIDTVIDGDEQRRHQSQLLQSIPGIGLRTTVALLADLPDINSFRDAKQLAAYVGLPPVIRQSGTSLHRASLPSSAKRRLRAALFLPALVAAKVNPDVAAVRTRLLAANKPKMVAASACAHKLLRICYGVIHNDTPYKTQAA